MIPLYTHQRSQNEGGGKCFGKDVEHMEGKFRAVCGRVNWHKNVGRLFGGTSWAFLYAQLITW